MTYTQLQRLESDINIARYDLMLHSIGFQRNQVHKYKFHAYRNYFCESISDDITDWEMLREFGVAEMIDKRSNAIYFRLTQLGIEFVEAREGIKIIFDN